MVKFYQYFMTSVAMSAAMVVYACLTREQFYPIILLLVSSKVSFVIGANMVVAMFILSGKVGIRLFFNELRDAELEVIRERAKFTTLDTLFILGIFRDEMTPSKFFLFGLLIFFRIFLWICRSRLDYLEQVARVSLYTNFSLLVANVLILLVCVTISYLCMVYSMDQGRTVVIVFSFEFAVLVLSAISNLVRYIVNVIDGLYENGLQNKGLYFMILDVIYDFIIFLTYLLYAGIIYVNYGPPLHILRDAYMAFASFFMRMTSFIRYLKLTRNMDARLEDAIAEDLAAHEDGGCLICREGMESGKKLACGHVFHLDCLRTWLQHQQTCPLCRANIQIPTGTAGTAAEEQERRIQHAIAAAVAAAEREGRPAHVQEQGEGEHSPGRTDLEQMENIDREGQQVGTEAQPDDAVPEQAPDPQQHQPPPQTIDERHLPPQQERQSANRSFLLPQTAHEGTRGAHKPFSPTSRSLLATRATSTLRHRHSSVTASLPRSHRHRASGAVFPSPHHSDQPTSQLGQEHLPGFFAVQQGAVTVHQRPLITTEASSALRVLPPGAIVFATQEHVERGTEIGMLRWLQIPDGWVLASRGREVFLRPYCDSPVVAEEFGAEVKKKLKEMQVRKSNSDSQNASTGHQSSSSVPISTPLSSSESAAATGPKRVKRLLRMQQDMTRLRGSLEAVQGAVDRLSQELLNCLQEEVDEQGQEQREKQEPIVLGRGGTDDEKDITPSTPPAPPAEQASGVVLPSVAATSTATATATTTVTDTSQSEKEPERQKSAVDSSPRSAFNTPARAAGLKKVLSPFSHLLHASQPIQSAPSFSTSPVSSAGDEATCGGDSAGVKLSLPRDSSSPIVTHPPSSSSPSSEKTGDLGVRELRAKYFSRSTSGDGCGSPSEGHKLRGLDRVGAGCDCSDSGSEDEEDTNMEMQD